MDTRKGNAIYLIFLFTVIPIFMMFIIIPVVQASRADNSLNVDYNKTLELNDYIIKISDAAYLTDKKELDFMLSVKANKQSPTGSYPEITQLTITYNNGDLIEKNSDFSIKTLNDISEIISVNGINKDIKSVKIIVESTQPEYYDADTTDEFGDVIKGEKHESETYGQMIVIDGKDIEYISSSEYDPQGKDISENNIDNENISENNDNSSVQAYNNLNQPVTIPKNTKKKDAVDYEEWLNEQNRNKATTTKKSTQVSKDNSSLSENKSNQDYSENSPSNNTDNNNADYSDNNYYENNNPEDNTSAQTQSTTQTQVAQPPQTTRPVITMSTTTQPSVIYVTGIKLNTGIADNNIRLSSGDTYQISAIISPSNATNQIVIWSSNRIDIATIDSNGNITAQGSGKAIITATTSDGGLTASCMVTVS